MSRDENLNDKDPGAVDDRRICRHLDGAMDETERIAFEAEVDRDPELRARLAELESIDVLARGALGRMFENAPPRAAQRRASGAASRHAAQSVRRSVGRGWSRAAAWLIVGLGIGVALRYSGFLADREAPAPGVASDAVAPGAVAPGVVAPGGTAPASERPSARAVADSPGAASTGDRRPATTVAAGRETGDPDGAGAISEVFAPGAEEALRGLLRDAVGDGHRSTIWTERKLYGAVGENDEIYLFEVERSRAHVQPATHDL